MRPLVVVALVGLLLAPSLPAESNAPHILVRIQNDDDEMTVRLLAGEEDEEPFFDERVRLPRGELTLVAIDAPHGEYRVRLERTVQLVEATPTPLDATAGLAGGVWTHGCDGAYGMDFSFHRGGFSYSPAGCLVLTEPFRALLAEAKTARADLPRASARIPLPGDGDRGVYDHGGEMPFEWRDGARWLDAWGREVRGAEVSYMDNFGSAKGTGSIFGFALAQSFESIELLRFEAGETTPSAWTRTDPRHAEGGPAGVAAALAREVRYDEARLDASCYLRHGLQGTVVRAGDRVPAETLCPHWSGPDWRAAAPIAWKGLSALPLYRVEESAERTLAERVLLLDGVPYLAEHQQFVLPQGSGVDERSASLERLELRAVPIDTTPSRLPPPSADLAPLDPLRGPPLADGARLRLTLREAVDAALADPTLGGLAAVTARPDSLLVGALYVEHEGATTGPRASWFLLFGAGEELAYAICERPTTPLPLPLPPRCSVPSGPQWRLYDWAGALSQPPPMTRAELPSHAPSFDAAVARWEALRPEGATPRATFAVYRPWADDDLGEPALLAVGLRPAEPLAPTSEPSTGDHAALRLDGSTYAAVELTQTRAVFAPRELAPLSLRAQAPEPAFRAGDIPLVAGAGALGIGLLVLLALLLYSRLVRARVLDDATRAAIHDVVSREPGLHASGILERLGKHSGVGEYHLSVLVREGQLVSLSTAGFRRYFVIGRYSPAQMRVMAALREGRNETLYALIRQNPGIHLASLAERAQVSLPYASKSVTRLADAGLVQKLQAGRAVELHPREDAELAGLS